MTYAATILLLPLISAAAILLGLKRNANISALVATGSAVATFVLSIMVLTAGQTGVAELLNWSQVGALKLGIDLQVDALSSGMMIVVTGVGALVHVFSLAYMKDDAGKARYFAGLALFMFSMTGIVYAANFAMMFIFWELVGVSSYILIGHWYTKNSAADAAKKAFLTNRIGDFGFMIGILLLWSMTGGLLDFDSLKVWFGSAAVETVAPAAMTAAVLCIFCGTVGKSAQFPLHVWLPDAMEGPTPVSALIHAATMVAAGVYMLVRVSFLIAASAFAADVIAWVGGITALLAALMATQQNDIKRILAYSTLSQLGYMVMAVGLGASQASMFHLFTHAWFKAGLFLGSGAIIYACHHEQNIWKMGGLKAKMPVTFATFAACTAALIAVPLTSGWWSKEAILDAAWEHNKLLFISAAFTALLTAFYMTRLVVVTFFGKARDEHGAGHAHEVPGLMQLPLVILAVLGLAAGFFGFLSTGVLGDEFKEFAHIHIGVPAIVSLITLVAGAGLAWKLYSGRDTDPVNIKAFTNKFYFDELYAKLIAICQDGVAAVVKVFDALLIDGAGVGGAKSLATNAGNALRRIQSGNLQAYAFLFGLGVLVIVFLALAR